MKFSSILLAFVILLISCDNKDWEITPEKFAHKNLTKFEFDFTDIKDNLIPIKDPELVNYLLRTVKPELSDESLKYLREEPSYFHSWQSEETDNLKKFTVLLNSDDCTENLYYFIMESSGKIKSHYLIASNYFCAMPSGISYSKTYFKDHTSFTTYKYHQDMSDIAMFPEESEKECFINEEGVIECDSLKNMIQVVCLWDQLTIKDSPHVSGKYLTSVKMGEKFYDLGETKLDEESKEKIEYIKVKLSDGTIGWVQNRFVASNAMPVVFTTQSNIYKRPDVLTKTEKYFHLFDIAGAFEYSDDYKWMRVKGKPADQNWFSDGWIKTENISTYSPDLVAAALYKEALLEKDSKKHANKLKEIADNPLLESSVFISKLKEIIRPKSQDPAEIISKIGTSFTILTEYEGDWVIYKDCIYDPDAIVFAENGSKYYRYSGPQEKIYDIISMKETDEGIVMTSSLEGEDEVINTFISEREKGIITIELDGYKSRYINDGYAGQVTTIEPECDPEEY